MVIGEVLEFSPQKAQRIFSTPKFLTTSVIDLLQEK
jgi:hypothetical protein